MKNIFIPILFFCLNVFSQEVLTIKGTTTSITDGTIELVPKNSIYYNHVSFDAKQKITNAKFEIQLTFKDDLNYPFVFFINDTISSAEFYLSKELMPIQVEIDDLDFRFVPKFNKVNEPINKERLTFQSFLKKDREDIRRRRDSIEAQYKKDQDKEKWIEQSRKLTDEDLYNYNQNLLKFIKEHPTSNYALWALISIFDGQGYAEVYETSFNLFDEQIKESSVGTRLKKEMNKLKLMTVNNHFPSFNAYTTENEKIKLDFTKLGSSNTYTLVDFWFTSCGPCVAEYEILKGVYHTYNSTNFDVIAVSVDQEAFQEKWKKHIIDNGYVWQNYLDKNSAFARAHNINFFPQNFLLDSNGVILKKNISMKELAEFLEENL